MVMPQTERKFRQKSKFVEKMINKMESACGIFKWKHQVDMGFKQKAEKAGVRLRDIGKQVGRQSWVWMRLPAENVKVSLRTIPEGMAEEKPLRETDLWRCEMWDKNR